MFIFYEESGQFKIANIVTRNESSYAVDTTHGKRAKIKASNVFFEIENDENFLDKANALAQEIDIDLLWQVCTDEVCTAQDVAHEYFGENPSLLQQAALLIAFYNAPMYFYKKGKGQFKAAPESTLRQALAAVARKQEQENQMACWIEELNQKRLPAEIANDLSRILHTPDKQSLTYKAFAKAADAQKCSLFDLAQQVGGIESFHQYLLDDFVLKNFPKGTQLPEIPIPDYGNLPLANSDIRAFSIDDESTTEIDDALSVQVLPDGARIVGVHIAAPTLAIEKDSAIEQIYFSRHSTVYYPSGKITLLPENWIKAFSLDEGDFRPCVSIYFRVQTDGSYEIEAQKIEKVFIDKNLRIQHIESFFNRENAYHADNLPQFEHHQSLQWLYQWAIQLQKMRGKYEENAPIRYEYSVLPDFDTGKIDISRRERGSPIDTTVSEMMILANSHWARQLSEHQRGAIYRIQMPMQRVKMSTFAQAHDGMGVTHYAWLTSPLRRTVDCLNQMQLISILSDRASRFNPKDSGLFALLQNFESTYTLYNDFQSQMEAYWSLRYIQQEKWQEAEGTLLRNDLVRINGVPLIGNVHSVPLEFPPRTQIKMRIEEIHEISTKISLKYLSVISA